MEHKWTTHYISIGNIDLTSGLKCMNCGIKLTQDQVEDIVNSTDRLVILSMVCGVCCKEKVISEDGEISLKERLLWFINMSNYFRLSKEEKKIAVYKILKEYNE